MKKAIIFSALTISILLNSFDIMATGNHPRGHKQYAKHTKHHKAHKMHKPHGIIDATYQ